MKKPAVDYRALRPNNITSHEYRHLLLLLGWAAYFLLYLLTENLIPESSCHIMHSALDDKIPFLEGFAIVYVLWYAYVFGSLLRYVLYDIESFKRLQIFIMITQAVAMAAYIIYPTMQDLRPEISELGRSNVLTKLMAFIYSFDTPTGVCPSLHVGYSVGIASVCLKEKGTNPVFKCVMALFALLVCVSVVFVKQHSTIDVYWGLAVGALAEIIVYGRSFYLPKIKRLIHGKA